MSVTTLELKPDRLLMDSSFDGYKLSLEELKMSRKNLDVPVDQTFLNSSQYGLLHAKLFGLHNHLFVDQYDDFSSVYFVDQHFNIQKTYVEGAVDELVDPICVFTIPKARERTSGDYNVTLRFASAEHAVASDGMGSLHILATKDKRDDNQFESLFPGKVLEQEDQGFVISDALYNAGELHVLLLNIQEDPVDRFVSVIHWLTFKETSETWGQSALRRLKTKGEVQYLHLERNCEHVYVVSENPVSFMVNSEHPVQAERAATLPPPKKLYRWSQTLEDVSVKLPLGENAQKGLVKVSAERSTLSIAYDDKILISGDLGGQIDPSLLTWTLGGDNILETTLTKAEGSIFWEELIKNDKQGEYIMEQPNEGYSEGPQAGTTFNSQQIEECDFETDKSETFERISGNTNTTTHRIHLGSHQVLLSPYISPALPPALGIRHDVDVCLWQPLLEANNFRCKHEGTLLVFGYVQASKTNRKFVTCAPNLGYSVVSESSGHIFIYRQNKPLLASDLRHRATGRRVKNVAQQQVFHLPNQNILGLFAGNNHLYILGEVFIASLTINAPED